MPYQRCRRSLVKEMSNAGMKKDKDSTRCYKKRLRSADDDDEASLQPTKNRRVSHIKSDSPRKSPRFSKCVESPALNTRLSKIIDKITKESPKIPKEKVEVKKTLISVRSTSSPKVSSLKKKLKTDNPKKVTEASKRSAVEAEDESCDEVIKSTYKTVMSNDSSSDDNPVPTKSFYSGSRTPYVTPLQRKKLAEKRSVSLSKMSVLTNEHVKLDKKDRHKRSQSQSANAKKGNLKNLNVKNNSNNVRAHSLLKIALKHAEQPDENKNNILVDSKLKKTSPVKKNNNKFFTNRSPGKKLKLALKNFGVSKQGFNMSFGAKKVKRELLTKAEKENADSPKVRKVKFVKKPLYQSYIEKESNLVEENLSTEKELSIEEQSSNSTPALKKCPNKVQTLEKDDDSGRSSAMSGSSEISNTYSTGADSVILLPEVGTQQNISHESMSIISVNKSIHSVRSSAMSGSSEISNTYSTGADSVILLLDEPVEDCNVMTESDDDGNSDYKNTQVTEDSSPRSSVSEKGSSGQQLESCNTMTECDDNEDTQVTATSSPKSTVSEKGSSGQMSLNSSTEMDNSAKELQKDESVAVSCNSVNIVESLKANKKLYSIFTPAAQSSPTQIKSNNSCPATPSSHSSLSAASSPVHSNSSKSSPKQVWKKMKNKDGKEQMILDFGQRLHSAQPCAVCGITYTRGDPTDEATHSKFHQKILNVLKFPGWRKERVVQNLVDGGRILMILPDDKQSMKKVNAVKQVVDQELGFVVEGTSVRTNSKIFFCVSNDKRIVGFCIAEVITKGYRVLSEEEVQLAVTQSPTKRVRPLCCSTKPKRAKCGINRIWVLRKERNKGIASKLVDCVRYNFLHGNILSLLELAFSDPTPDGQIFASKYTGTEHFLVYHKQS